MGKGNSPWSSLPGFDIDAAEKAEADVDPPIVHDHRIPGKTRGRNVRIDFLNLAVDDRRIRTPQQLRE